MSVHAVHAGAERNVCNIVVSTETPQTTTNPSLKEQILVILTCDLFICTMSHPMLIVSSQMEDISLVTYISKFKVLSHQHVE